MRRPLTTEEWLARIVIQVAGDVGPSSQWIEVACGVVTRMKHEGMTVSDVAGSMGDETWLHTLVSPGGVEYRDGAGRRSPVDHPRYDDALGLAFEVLHGKAKERR